MNENRHQIITNLIKKKAFMTIHELCLALNVSPATIRRDLSQLEKSGSILRVNGGAILLPAATDKSSDEEQPADPFLDEKRRIAQAASALVKEGDTVFMDAGSTNLHIANEIESISNITIITNSLLIAYKFVGRKDISVIICGGTLGEANPASIVGTVAETMILSYRANISLVGTSGLHVKQGITDPYSSAALIKKRMIESSNHVVMVTDHSKFGKTNTFFVCPIDDIDHVITGHLAPEPDVHFLRNNGIEVTLV